MNKYTIDEDYFDQLDNEYVAYVLGYLYAKGSVFRGQEGERYELTISGTDKRLLERIKRLMQSTHPIKDNGDSFKIRVASKAFVLKLQDLGLTANKTQTLMYPNFLNNNNERHFMRGYFDGKGSFMIEAGRRVTANIAAGSYRFIEGFRDRLVSLGLSKANIHQYGAMQSTNIIRYYIKDTKKLYGLLYSDARIYSRTQEDRYFLGVYYADSNNEE